ncbi:MAG: hypothetical protein O2856_11300, partial [Planctomycetota bacterium]|nr:hypothetical protein [Planctomycetota bacterium]
MTTSHGRRIQSRRALAIMAWVSLVGVAGLLWYGQEKGIIRIQAWEPAALLLSAYSAFLAIFGWLLFAPERRSAEESPALFFSGMLTLIPPCFIAYHLMPPSSPLRGWLTLGIFVFGLIAILSPLPDEVFAVPRDRKSYLQPLTDSYLSALDVEEPQLDLQSLVPRSCKTLTGYNSGTTTTFEQGLPPTGSRGVARDPWSDPFYGTGRSLSQVGSSRRSAHSESRTRGADPRPATAPLREPASEISVVDVTDRESAYRNPPDRGTSIGGTFPKDSSSRDQSQNKHRDRSEPQTRDFSHGPVQERRGSSSPPPLPVMPPATPSEKIMSSSAVRPPMIPRSAFAPRESRAPNYKTPAASTPATSPARRPLTEPGGRTTPAVGFQSPPAPAISSPVARAVVLPPAPPAIPRELPSQQAPAADPLFGLGAMTAAAPLASAATYDDVLKSAVAEFNTTANPLQSTPQTNLYELDRRIKELQAEDDDEDDSARDSSAPSAMSPATHT